MGLLDGLHNLDHATLYNMRAKAKSKEEQDKLAGYEHRAFSREVVKENPLMALSLLVATPGYQLAKAAGLTNSRSGASMSQMGQGLLGIGEGLYQRFK
jgi:hypothetical protein